MNLDEYISISSKPSVFKIVNARQNGVLAEHLDTGKVSFYPSRKYQFTPLGSIAIYTLEDSEPLANIFKTMLDMQAKNPAPTSYKDKMVIMEYFDQILPDYDENRVYISDMKKVIKWFNFLNERGLLTTEDVDTTKGDEEE